MPSADAAVRDFCTPIHRMVQAEREQIGFKAAIAKVARWSGLSERRVRAVEHNEIRTVLLAEMRLVEAAYTRWCQQRAQRLAMELQQVEADLERLGQP